MLAGHIGIDAPVPGIQLLMVLFRAEVEHPPEDYFFRVVHHGREYHQLSLLSNTYLVPVDEVGYVAYPDSLAVC